MAKKDGKKKSAALVKVKTKPPAKAKSLTKVQKAALAVRLLHAQVKTSQRALRESKTQLKVEERRYGAALKAARKDVATAERELNANVRKLSTAEDKLWTLRTNPKKAKAAKAAQKPARGPARILPAPGPRAPVREAEAEAEEE